MRSAFRRRALLPAAVAPRTAAHLCAGLLACAVFAAMVAAVVIALIRGIDRVISTYVSMGITPPSADAARTAKPVVVGS